MTDTPLGIVVHRPVSSRDASVAYEVRHHEGAYTCTCPGFTHRQACKHTIGAQADGLTAEAPEPDHKRRVGLAWARHEPPVAPGDGIPEGPIRHNRSGQ